MTAPRLHEARIQPYSLIAEQAASAIEADLAMRGISDVTWLPTGECIVTLDGCLVGFARTPGEGTAMLVRARARRLKFAGTPASSTSTAGPGNTRPGPANGRVA